MVVTNLKLNRLPLDPLPVYHFIRYGNRVRLNILDPFGMDSFQKKAETKYLQALLEYQQGNPATAVEYITEYLRDIPQDYSARYYLDMLQQEYRWRIYPADGNLLQDAFAPRAYLNHSFRLLDDGNVRADFYVPPPVREGWRIVLRFGNPNQIEGLITLTFDDDRNETIPFSEERMERSFAFTPAEGRNVVNLFFMLRDTSARTTEPQWILLEELRVESPQGK